MAFDIHQTDRVDPDSEEAEKKFEKYMEGLIGLFLESPEGKKRQEIDPGIGFWAAQLMDYGFRHLGTSVARMTVGDVKEVVKDIFPRKISLQSPDDADDAMPELIAFWEYLKREFGLPQAEDVLKLLRKMEPGFGALMNDPSKFGMAKSFFMLGQAAGYDMSRQEEMDAFIQEYNTRLLAGQALSGSGTPPFRLNEGTGRRNAGGKSEKRKRKQAQASRRKNWQRWR